MAKFNPKNRRSIVVNILAVVNQIIDGYKGQERRVSHWVQKDGGQNCWDARKEPENKHKKWKCETELIEKDGHSIVVITDYGTWGLTGRRYDKEDLEQADLPPEERWCRFENYAFFNENAKDRHLLGSRGRGKFVFSAASKTMTTIYDTLRDDEIYRAGKRVVEKLDAPNDFEEGDEARKIIVSETHGLVKPLTHVGSRIIILNPVKELIDDILDGTMERFISETWWEIIEKFDAQFIIKSKGKSSTVKPFTESLPCSAMTPTKISRPKSSPEQEVFIKESVPIPGTKFRIKKFYILYDPHREFDDRQRGISVQRAGMSITHHDTKELGPSLSAHITGYATFESGFEDEMRKTEGVEHYSYNWNTNPTKAVSYVLTKLYREFATKQLGWREGKSAKAKKSDKKANARAINQANKIAKKIMGSGKGTTRTKTKKRKKFKRKPLKMEIQINDLGFPDPDIERVDYGQTLTSIGARVVNDTGNDLKFGIKIEVRSVERDIQVLGKYIYDNQVTVKKQTISDYCCNESIKIEKSDFTPGHYKIRAKLSLLTPFGKYRKGQDVDISLKSFYVEVDPPQTGLWEDFVPVDFSSFEGDDKTRKAFHRDGSRLGSYILCYNPDHAEHKKIKDTDTSEVAKYRYKLTIPEFIMLDYENEWEVVFAKEDHKDLAKMLKIMKDTEDKYTDSKYVDDV